MTRRIAVITDALSDGFFFPVWHRYYGQAVGTQNLFVATYPGMGASFLRWPLGGIWEIPRPFDETLRASAMPALIDRLLETYEIVVRVDTDEVLVADPRRWPNLAAYLGQLDRPFVTARGLDVFQHPAEPALDWQSPLLAQRQFAFPLTSLNKTCVTAIALRWSAGFHGCTVHPMFDDLLLLHIKRIDVAGQAAWSEHMNRHIQADGALRDYYRPDIGEIRGFNVGLAGRPILEGYDGIGRIAFDARFFAGIRYDRTSVFYEIEHCHDDVLVRLPDALRGVV